MKNDSFDTALWLALMRELPSESFTLLASRFDFSPEEWNTFWKALRASENDIVEQVTITVHKGIPAPSKEGEIEVMLGSEEFRISQAEFDLTKRVLNNDDPVEISNCCGARVYPHRADDHSSICTQCKEGCGIVYLF